MLTPMGSESGQDIDDLRLFHTAEHPCGYWPERIARDLVMDPRDPKLAHWYPQALQWGFRRSGDIVYRPHCQGCRACVAVRIQVDRFQPDRSQRRCLAQNAAVTMRVLPPERTDEQLSLYQRYLGARHRNGGMDDHGAGEFDQFLTGRWSNGRFIELRDPAPSGPGRLLAVAVTDVVPGALSAVYTFFDPAERRRGLGTLAVLHQLRWAATQDYRHLYLGYWIKDHPKMDYKRRFRPLEGFDGRNWREMDTGDGA